MSNQVCPECGSKDICQDCSEDIVYTARKALTFREDYMICNACGCQWVPDYQTERNSRRIAKGIEGHW